MSTKSMDVFSLRDSFVGGYRKFATSFTTIQAGVVRKLGDLKISQVLSDHAS